jgi:hypothetical protein
VRDFVKSLLKKPVDRAASILLDKLKQGHEVLIFQYQHVAAIVVRGVSASLTDPRAIIHPTAKDHTEEPALMTEPARQLIQFGIVKFFAVVFTLNEHADRSRLRRRQHSLEEAAFRCVGVFNIYSLPALMYLMLFDRTYEARIEQERTDAHRK